MAVKSRRRAGPKNGAEPSGKSSDKPNPGDADKSEQVPLPGRPREACAREQTAPALREVDGSSGEKSRTAASTKAWAKHEGFGESARACGKVSSRPDNAIDWKNQLECVRTTAGVRERQRLGRQVLPSRARQQSSRCQRAGHAKTSERLTHSRVALRFALRERRTGQRCAQR